MKKLRDNKITASRKLAACAIALLQLFYYMRKPSRRPLAAMGWCDNFKRLRIRKCELSPRVMALQPTVGYMCCAPDHNFKISTTLHWRITHIPCYVPLILMNMKTLKVVNLKSESKSFSWNDGLFAIQKQVGDIIHLWKIKDGKLDKYEDGTPNITCTGVNNKGIIPTDLVIYA